MQLGLIGLVPPWPPFNAAHNPAAQGGKNRDRPVLPPPNQVLCGFALIPGEILEKMSKLANVFAVLNLDADDDREEVEEPTSTKKEAAATNKLGLDITKDRILEIACIITDGKLTKRIEGPDLVIRQSKECLDDMNEWCKIHHETSGLTEQVLQSDLSEHDAEKQVLDFIKRCIGSATPLISGNSVYMDLLFLKVVAWVWLVARAEERTFGGRRGSSLAAGRRGRGK